MPGPLDISTWVAAEIQYDGGKLVLVEEAEDKWVMPYGEVAIGAHPEDAIKATVLGKTGLTVDVLVPRDVNVHTTPANDVITIITYSAIYENGDLLDHPAAQAFDKAALDILKPVNFRYGFYRVLRMLGWVH